MTVERLPWHAAHWDRVERALGLDRLPHAMLLRGVPGLGKGAFARAVATLLLCRVEEGGHRPCGSCKSCALVEAGNHPDLLTLAPLEEKRAIGIDQVRDLIGQLSLTASFAGRQVAVIEPAEALTHAAANTLLKTLEEPAGPALFMLVSHRSAILPATVRSRCQMLDFHVPEASVAADWLADRVGDADPFEVLRLAGGAPLAAVELAATNAASARARLIADVAAIVDGRADPVSVAEQWKNLGEPAVTASLVAVCEDLARIKSRAPADALSFAGSASALHDIAGRLDLVRVHRLHGELLELRRAEASQLNLNAQLALEAIAIRWRQAAGG